MEIKQLYIHGGLVCEMSWDDVLAECLVIGEPNSARKMAICLPDQQLVLHKVFPAIGEAGDHD